MPIYFGTLFRTGPGPQILYPIQEMVYFSAADNKSDSFGRPPSDFLTPTGAYNPLKRTHPKAQGILLSANARIVKPYLIQRHIPYNRGLPSPHPYLGVRARLAQQWWGGLVQLSLLSNALRVSLPLNFGERTYYAMRLNWRRQTSLSFPLLLPSPSTEPPRRPRQPTDTTPGPTFSSGPARGRGGEGRVTRLPSSGRTGPVGHMMCARDP